MTLPETKSRHTPPSILKKTIQGESVASDRVAMNPDELHQPAGRLRLSILELNLRHLQYTQEMSGYILKLTVEQSHTASWRKRFLLLDRQANLLMFRTSTCNSRGNKPLTYMCVDSCDGYYSDLYGAWILEILGDGVSVDKQFEKVTWVLKCSEIETAWEWIRKLHAALATKSGMLPTSSGMEHALEPNRKQVKPKKSIDMETLRSNKRKQYVSEAYNEYNRMDLRALINPHKDGRIPRVSVNGCP
ncbi:hypothetical protein BDR26DRAFT_924626, partial [Obelidium mucronatum]